jgi:hypothetical protein
LSHNWARCWCARNLSCNRRTESNSHMRMRCLRAFPFLSRYRPAIDWLFIPCYYSSLQWRKRVLSVANLPKLFFIHRIASDSTWSPISWLPSSRFSVFLVFFTYLVLLIRLIFLPREVAAFHFTPTILCISVTMFIVHLRFIIACFRCHNIETQFLVKSYRAWFLNRLFRLCLRLRAFCPLGLSWLFGLNKRLFNDDFSLFAILDLEDLDQTLGFGLIVVSLAF